MAAITSPGAAAARISQRAPMSCVRCSSKKMKCTKTIPCQQCVDSGNRELCRREQVITTKHIRQAHNHIHKRREAMTSRIRPVGISSAIKQDRDDGQPPLRQPGQAADVVRNNLPHERINSQGQNKHDASSNSSTINTAYSTPPGYYQQSTPNSGISETSTYNEQADIENAAQSLELLAWGRQRDTMQSPNSTVVMTSNTDILLPRQARLILCYHRDWISWTHNTIHWSTFLQECSDYWLEGRVVEQAWLAIYNAALCAALIVMPIQHRLELSVHDDTAKRLYQRAIEALRTADYAANHSRRCVQAICLITPCAHVFGDSNLYAVLLSSAIRIAQSLNMHRIGPDPKDVITEESQRDREIQKSLWTYLCIQDWFNIPFANAYAISPSHSTTPRPLNSDCISGLDQASDVSWRGYHIDCPTQMTYSLNMIQVADVCRAFFDKTASMTSDASDDQSLRALYEHVLTADAQILNIMKTCSSYLRAHATNEDPLLSIQKTVFVISVQNKLLSIHKRFFLRSLADRWYTYTRLACLNAAKSILEEYQTPTCQQVARNAWQTVAHVISACVVLLLAMILSEEDYHDRSILRKLICDCVDLLATSSNMTDMLQRGIKLISIMLNHEAAIQSGQRKRNLDIVQIATELQQSDDARTTSINDNIGNNFAQMAGALDLDLLLPQSFGEVYAPYFGQVSEYAPG